MGHVALVDIKMQDEHPLSLALQKFTNLQLARKSSDWSIQEALEEGGGFLPFLSFFSLFSFFLF